MSTKDNASNDQGVVYKKSTGIYFVHPIATPGGVIPCAISNRLRKQLVYPTAASSSLSHRVRQVKALEHSDPIAIGDVVHFHHTGDGAGLIFEMLPRRNRLARRTAGRGAFEQVVAANLDQVIPVFAAAQPYPHWNLLDRYLAAAESFGLAARVCITKVDLARGADGAIEPELKSAVGEYRKIGYPVHLLSPVTGEGLDELRAALGGRTSVLVGKSGVGKTSLLNALQPGLGLRVNAVNQTTGKGKHTTTWLELFGLDSGGAILDTPGMREYGLWDVHADDLALLFPELRPWLGQCRFGLDCRHAEEPGCAIRKAVMAGEISPRRYQSYLRLREDGGGR
ncbi:MAG: ribosome small subunit-dependent GTPase A [Anaerolineaceae bacterium]|nr:ribosome small subunit-dependent GTPase A [Anaerolineaceae bacterium]